MTDIAIPLEGGSETPRPTRTNKPALERIKVMRYCVASMPDSMLPALFLSSINRTAACALETTGTNRKTRLHGRTILTTPNAGYETLTCKLAADTRGTPHGWVGVVPP
jgi:alanine dehydrogenase